MQKDRDSEKEGFVAIARKLGCDPDDPRVAEVLKAMAQQPPKPHGKGAETGDRREKPEKG